MQIKRMIKRILILAVIAAFFISSTSKDHRMEVANILLSSEEEDWADAMLNKMSVDEKIGQLFMMSVWSEWGDAKMRKVYDEAKRFHVGGVCFFAGEAARQVDITNRLNAAAKTPLLVGIDGEWGAGMRVTDAHRFPYAMNIGAVSDSTLVYEMGKQIGEHCNRLGVHINFAPVHDLNSNPLNPVINFRSYGSGVDNVSVKVNNYVNGMQSQGVLAVAKHFPGHGDTHTDSHHALPTINKSRADFEAQEFVPFRQSMDKGLQAIMMGHLHVPALDSHDLPASLSEEIIYGIIKQEMGFDGLIVSDALNMDAVAKGYKNHYLKAFIAGNDILLFPADLGEGVRQIKKGLADGSISIQELDERCRRVLSYKKALGVPDFSPIPTDGLVEDLNPAKSKVLNRLLLSQSITLVRNVGNALPMKRLGRKKIAVISINDANAVFCSQIRLYAKAKTYNETVKTVEDVQRLLPQLMAYDEIIVGLHGNQKRSGVNYGINRNALDLITQLAQEKSVHAVLMANPYALRKMTGAEFVALKSLSFAYGNEKEIQALAADAVMGGIAYRGVFPLDVNEFLKEGLGYTTKASRLGYTTVPEELGLNSDSLAKIDELIEEVVAKKMAPGCQILVAKNGKVAYHKSFGYHTYDKVCEVKNTDLYDIASVTKVAATTPLVMKLVDEGLLNLNIGISHYLPELKGNPKGKLTLKELLLHQAGLMTHIGFDFNLIDEERLSEKLFHKGRTSTYNIKLTPTIYMTRNYVMKEGYISSVEDEHCSVKVAEGVYTFPGYRDEMYQMMDDSELYLNKNYRYSDLGYYYVTRVLEAVSQQTLDALADEKLYKPIGMFNTCYNPLDHFWKENIVPTVDEMFFRKQLLQGYVHDQGAALLGGVAGHAGLFSNANDLAKLLQVYLNDGFYGHENYFKPETIKYFTQHTENSYRRGVGFDKPEADPDRPQPTCDAASLSTFGHTGFTGTGVWADPEHDLIYIILSNRVCPHPYNKKFVDEDIRPRVQQIIYDAMIWD